MPATFLVELGHNNNFEILISLTLTFLEHRYCFAYFHILLALTRPFRYDLNQIPYDYTVEVTNRFKGLDLIDRVFEELWTEVSNIV